MLKDRYDVVIVGAGPAGAGAAKALAGHDLNAVIIEKSAVPRYKMCSGILFPSAVKQVTDDFGELPESVLSDPVTVEGGRVFLDLDSPGVDVPLAIFDDDPDLGEDGVNVDRGAFDHWLCLQSGIPIVDQCPLRDVEREGGEFVLELCLDGLDAEVRTKYLIGADGTRSAVREACAGEFEESVRLLPQYEEWYTGTIDLPPGRLHMFFDHRITGYFATVFHKDGQIAVVTGTDRGEIVKDLFAVFRRHLEEKHGLSVEKKVMQSGCAVHDMAARQNYFLGEGNVVLAGEAGGFNRCGEGITSALVTGKAAGEAVLASIDSGGAAAEYYAKAVEPEIEACTKVNEAVAAMIGLNPFLRDDAELSPAGGS